jgi:hypothetical protein
MFARSRSFLVMTSPRELSQVDDAPGGVSRAALTRARSPEDWRGLIERHHHRVVLGPSARRQPGGEELVVDRQPSPEQRLLSRQQVQQALDVVAASGASAQRLFRLLYAEPSLSHAQAAGQLGLSVQRVRQILCELRKRVRAVLEGDRP